MRKPTTSPAEATRLLQADHQLLLDRIDRLSEAELRAPYRVVSGPLGHFCDSLHDLTAHLLMWDEITLDVLRDAAAGRSHWSLDPRWETAEAGSALNIGGVEAGRHIPSGLLLHRFHSVADALVAEIQQYDETSWNGIGALAEYAATPPDGALFGHAARHLIPA
jgi:hypothetical protein